MALMSGTLKAYARTIGTCVPSCTGRSTRLFFMLEARDPWGMWQCWSPPQSGGEVQSHMTRGSAGADLNREVRSGVIGHVAALEPTSTGMQGPEP
jgi:hypothetical protein